MVIKNISYGKNGSVVVLAATATFKGAKEEMVYFKTSYKNATFVCHDAGPFLAAFLIPCMKKGEDMIIEGRVSQKQLDNTKKIQRLFSGWKVGMKNITITASTIAKDVEKGQVGEFFSAGVDSFYTFLKHKKEIQNLVLVNGFDIELGNRLLWSQTLSNVKKVAGNQRVNVIAVETNVKNIIEKHVIWDWGHGGALGAVALFLRNGITTMYLAGSLSRAELFPYGTHPSLDKLWGTETLSLIHDGNEMTRFQKVKSISNSKLALKYLHVCAQNRKGIYNCATCSKCLRTMTELVTCNALRKTRTFPDNINLSLIENTYNDRAMRYDRPFRECLKILQQAGREKGLQISIQKSLDMSDKYSVKRTIIKYIKKFDQEVNNRRFYRLAFQMTASQDRSMFFKALSVAGVIK